MNTAIYSPYLGQIELGLMDLGWHLGDVVRKLRDAKGWSQTQLGKKAGGMSKNTIARLENGGQMAVETKTIDRVARVFSLSVGELYTLIPVTAEPRREVERQLEEQIPHIPKPHTEKKRLR